RIEAALVGRDVFFLLPLVTLQQLGQRFLEPASVRGPGRPVELEQHDVLLPLPENAGAYAHRMSLPNSDQCTAGVRIFVALLTANVSSHGSRPMPSWSAMSFGASGSSQPRKRVPA